MPLAKRFRSVKNWPKPRVENSRRATARTFPKSSPRSNESPPAPSARKTIAHRFIGGFRWQVERVPSGTAEWVWLPAPNFLPSLRGLVTFRNISPVLKRLSLPTSFLPLHHVCFYGCKSRENTGNRQCSKLTGTAFVTRANHGSPRPLTARILCVFQAIAQ